jgi:hypothetical protein
MIKFDITKSVLYRWRYLIGYIIVAAGLIAALLLVGLYLPGGLSNQEMQSVVKSDTISLANLGHFGVINLPYYFLQKASIKIFGVSILSIKLPSIILAFLAATGIVLLLRRLLKPSIGVLASLIAITTSQFLFIAQNGTPDVLYLLWPIWLILLANIVTYQHTPKRFYTIALCIIAALSLYTPLSVYVLIALLVAVMLHPHLRYLVKQLPRKELVIGATISLLLLIPLIIALVKTPNLILTLLGIPSHWPNLGANIALLGNQYFSFANPSGTTLMTPFFELGSMLIIAIGVFYVVQTISTAKSYIIAFWSICLIPIVIINPSFTSITFLPLIFLLAAGLNLLLLYWYRLFPNNPYARIGGLIPLTILVVVLISSGVGRYVYSYRYNPTIVSNFSKDLNLIPESTKNLVVADDELDFYKVAEKHNRQFTVNTIPSSNTFLATREANKIFNGYEITRIITSSSYNNGDRFYLYQKSTD